MRKIKKAIRHFKEVTTSGSFPAFLHVPLKPNTTAVKGDDKVKELIIKLKKQKTEKVPPQYLSKFDANKKKTEGK